MRKTLTLLLAFMLLFLLNSCVDRISDEKNDALKAHQASADKSHKEEGSESGPEDQDMNYSLWVAYWDLEDFKDEIKSVESKVHNISHFAAYFDEDKNLFIPKATRDNFQEFNKRYFNQYNNYLSYVNDIRLGDNTSSLKDKDLLYDLLSDEKTRKKHIEELILLANQDGYRGIEIDYEGMKDDLRLWQFFIIFIEELYIENQNEGLLLRVVLEPNVPYQKIKLPEGPEYVLMCYNLHGAGSPAGPKANKAFLKDMIDKSLYIPGDVNFALATGGYDFLTNGEVKALNERESNEKLISYGAQTIRDKESQALNFSYKDEEGIGHEIWYADKDTINYWINILKESGIENISLWKIGGNLELDSIIN